MLCREPWWCASAQPHQKETRTGCSMLGVVDPFLSVGSGDLKNVKPERYSQARGSEGLRACARCIEEGVREFHSVLPMVEMKDSWGLGVFF